MNIQNQDIELHRKFWAEIAQKNGWYTEPFYVQIWVDTGGNIADSVSFRGITEDVVIEE